MCIRDSNRSERALKYQMMDDVSIETYKCVLSLPDVSRHYQKTILKNLIDYYYEDVYKRQIEDHPMRSWMSTEREILTSKSIISREDSAFFEVG